MSFELAYWRAKAQGRRYATYITHTPAAGSVLGERALAAYERVLHLSHKPAALMESATHTGKAGRFSYVCLEGEDAFVLREQKDLATLRELLRVNSPESMQETSPNGKLNIPFTGGGVGFLGHESICEIEPTVLRHTVDPNGLPDGCIVFFRNVIAFDHEEECVSCCANVRTDISLEEARKQGEAATRRLFEMVFRSRPLPRKPESVDTKLILSDTSKEEYLQMVHRAKRHIDAGDIFQVVLSQEFFTEYQGSGVALYRALRAINPSPCMFHMRFGSECKNMTLLGASPEIMCDIQNRTMRIRPLAGTCKRGANEAEDIVLGNALLQDPKERAEHMMLVDLVRNDIGRFCTATSIDVPELMKMVKCSHVMHIGSEVRGTLRNEVHPLDACLGSLPAGTLSGAPKVRALQIIAELEKQRRGPYGGAFGWFTDTNLDTCIIIRSAMLLNGYLSWRAGAGIVADSIPENEWSETLKKAQAIRLALEQIGTQQ